VTNSATAGSFSAYASDVDIPELIGESACMRALRREIALIAATESTVLLTGETGSGKGVVARAVHRFSRRLGAQFVHVDCAALSPSLIESELFGHERGAFTGATMRHPGRFELAAQGTIFLDEIGDLDPHVQAKLLRVLEDREYERVGGAQTLTMRARVIAATSCNLAQAIEEGRFRSDLYFRLKVIHFHLPPLRHRLEDLPLLVRALVERMSGRLAVPTPRVSATFFERLHGHCWPGNVRELVNLVERLLVTRRGADLDAASVTGLLETLPEDLAHRPAVQALPGPVVRSVVHDPPPSLDAAYRDEITRILKATGGNVARAARRLAIPRSSLRYHIHRFGLKTLIPKD
jgi:transcriptional regulator with GAF, ATPase, and Fis domain